MESIPEHRTRILPLRWFANACNMYPAHWALHKALKYETKYENAESMPKAGHRWWKVYNIVNRPYDKWGTTYRIEWNKQ